MRYLLDSNDQPSGQSGTLLDYNGGRTYLKTQYVNFNHKWVLGATTLNEAYVQYGNHHEEIDAIYNTIPRVGVSGAFDLGSTTSYNPVNNHVVAFNNNLTKTMAGTRTGEHVLKAGRAARRSCGPTASSIRTSAAPGRSRTPRRSWPEPRAVTPPTRATAASSGRTRPTASSCRTTGVRSRA